MDKQFLNYSSENVPQAYSSNPQQKAVTRSTARDYSNQIDVTFDSAGGPSIVNGVITYYKERSLAKGDDLKFEQSVWIDIAASCTDTTTNFWEYPKSDTTGSFCTHKITDSSSSDKVTECKGYTKYDECYANSCIFVYNNCF